MDTKQKIIANTLEYENIFDFSSISKRVFDLL